MVSFTKTSKAFKEYNPEEAWRLLNHDLIGYDTATSKYLELHRLAKKDFTRNVPSQRIETFPVSGSRGLYGWTLLPTDGKIRRRAVLTQKIWATFLKTFFLLAVAGGRGGKKISARAKTFRWILKLN